MFVSTEAQAPDYNLLLPDNSLRASHALPNPSKPEHVRASAQLDILL